MTQRELIRLGRRIARARQARGLGLRGLAHRLGIDHTWLYRLELGTIREPDPARVAMVLDALDLSDDRRLSSEIGYRLPELNAYFRAKYDLTPEQVERVVAYVERLRRQS